MVNYHFSYQKYIFFCILQQNKNNYVSFQSDDVPSFASLQIFILLKIPAPQSIWPVKNFLLLRQPHAIVESDYVFQGAWDHVVYFSNLDISVLSLVKVWLWLIMYRHVSSSSPHSFNIEFVELFFESTVFLLAILLIKRLQFAHFEQILRFSDRKILYRSTLKWLCPCVPSQYSQC